MSWLTGWSYRKTIIIAPSADGAQTDYQLKLLVGESAGASGEQVDCAGHVLSSFNDLRFATDDGETLCDYWIESIIGATPNRLATVWVKIPSIAASPTTTVIYMYYGNAAASVVSSGANTFIVFDDFERGNDGDAVGGSWTVAVGSITISTAQKYGGSRAMRIAETGSGNPEVTIPRIAGTNYAIRFRLYKEDTAVFYFRHGNGTERINWAIYNTEMVRTYNGSWTDTGTPITPDAWQIFEINDINHTAPRYDIWLNGSRISDNTDMWENSLFSNVVGFTGGLTAGADTWIDDFMVRKWTAGEPAWNSFGTEEYLPPPPPDYHIILSAVYSEEAPEINRAFVVGMDAAGGQVSGSAVAQADVDLVGERMDARHDPSIPTATLAASVASAILAKCRLDGRRAEIVIPLHCGLELWDVLAVVDTVANQDTMYRVTGYQLEYDTVKGAYFHRLQLCAV